MGNALTARNYSTLPATHQCSVENYKLDPWWVTGFIDGEGCFDVYITENKKLNQGWEVQHRFSIVLHVKDKAILQNIQKHLGVGKNFKQGSQAIQLKVQSLKELETVINNFNMYTLMTRKCSDFKLLKMVIIKIKRKEHLAEYGLRKIVAIKAAMNRGLSDVLKKAFPDVVPVVRPLVLYQKILDTNWLAGLTSGEGCF